MDGLGVLDLRCFKKVTLMPPSVKSTGLPLDLRTTKCDNYGERRPLPAFASEKYHREEYHQPQQTPKPLSLSSTSSIQLSRWNHRSHPSLDSDSSFESEQEYDSARSHVSISSYQYDAGGLRRRSVDSLDRRESISSNDHQDSGFTDTDDRESYGSSPAVSLGFYKELPELTGNVSLKQRKNKTLIFQLSCEAEVLNAADVQSEITSEKDSRNQNNIINDGDDDDDVNDEDDGDDALQVDETASCFEELLQIELETPSHSDTTFSQNTSRVTQTIQEAANKCINEIRLTRKDLNIGAQNFQVGGSGKRLCCSKCKEEFYNTTALWQHLMTHPSLNPGEKLIKCPVCTKRFSTVNTLERHMLNLHTGEMKFVCDMCDTPFKFRTHLRRHMLNTRCSKGSAKKKRDSLETEKLARLGWKKKNSKINSGSLETSHF